MSNSIKRTLGDQIRIYRKANNLSQSALSMRINKSKATLCKYEKGDISIDIETLNEIADALNISVLHLLEFSLKKGFDDGTVYSREGDSGGKVMYMYLLDGRINRVVSSVLNISGYPLDERHDVHLYYDVNNIDCPDKFRGLYSGYVAITNPYMNFTFQNAGNTIEKLYIVAKKTFFDQDILNGLMVSISARDFLPICHKVIISESKLSEHDSSMNQIKFTKDDLSKIRRKNVLIFSEKNGELDK